MNIKICQTGMMDSFEQNINDLNADPNVKAIMILACDANGFTPEKVDPVLVNSRVPVFGGIFPQIIGNGKNMEKGTIMAGLFNDINTLTIPELSNDQADMDQKVASALEGLDCLDKTIFVFVDGLSTRISALIDGLFDNIGLMSNYIGGGAGSLSFEQKPCIFTSRGLQADSAVLAVSDVKSGVGVAHGWDQISQAMKVTESEKNRVISLNWEPAFQVYQQVIHKHSQSSFENEPFFDIAKAHPLGIVKLDNEMVVRDPIVMENNELVCVGEVPEGSFVYILKGDRDSLINGAVQARESARNNFSGNMDNSSMIFIDCISRVLFMEDDFYMELAAVDEKFRAIGALTLGEIANTGNSYLEFYNKTAVVGILEDPREK
ncbi:MAG: histidine kinase [Desulfonatronovibrio sp. MSAO_Bac4]|nr:MAG: histidine kinase [Desulfonatronovibrio sp. MSAO_Bac4]